MDMDSYAGGLEMPSGNMSRRGDDQNGFGIPTVINRARYLQTRKPIGHLCGDIVPLLL